MTTRSTLTRLDWSLFTLRWLLVASAVILAFAVPGLDSTTDPQMQSKLFSAAVVGVLIAIAGSALVLSANNSNKPGIIAIMVDTLYALLLFWVSDGMPILLIAAGALPVVIGALRINGYYGIFSAAVLGVAAPLLYGTAIAPDASLEPVLLASAALVLISVFIGVPVNMAALGWAGHQTVLKERAAESSRLRGAREHARAIYEMASTLSATLNYQAVLDAALDVGVLGLRQAGSNARLVSAVLLFDKNTNQLMVANSRRLTHADTKKQIPGKRGVLGLAIQQAEPVFANDAQRDPELKYFVAFQDARSILCVPLRAGFENYGVLVYGSTLPNAFNEEQVELLTAIASQATIALQNAMLYENLLEEKERIMEVEEDARKQLSRALHDGPTQSVAAIAMRVNYIRRLVEREPEQVPLELHKVEELARKTTKEIRHMLFTLRPLVLETQGLVPALYELAKKVQETHGQNVLLQVENGVADYIDVNDQSVLFNIVDEAVNNARKHAEANHVWVRLSKQEEYLILEVEDDGVGFDLGEVDANYDQRGSLGMINLRERAELLDGTIRIESAEGKGTKVTLLAPIRESLETENSVDTEPPDPTDPEPENTDAHSYQNKSDPQTQQATRRAR